MATLEKPRIRTPSITIALPPPPTREIRSKPLSSAPPSPALLPPSPLLRILDAANGDPTACSFSLPSVPTSEPSFSLDHHGHLHSQDRQQQLQLQRSDSVTASTIDSDFSDRESEVGSVASGSLSVGGPRPFSRLAMHSDGEGETTEGEELGILDDDEEEEELEELVDEPMESTCESGDRQRNDLAGLVLATQAAALLTLQTLLQQMQAFSSQSKPTRDGESSPLGSPADEIIYAALSILAQVSEHSEDRGQPLIELNLLLESLSTAALTAGATSTSTTNDNINIALALGELLQSLDKVHLPQTGRAAIESAQRQVRSPRERIGSTSTLASTSSASTSREELRDPFAEISEPDVFATLHRLISTLLAKCADQQRHVSRRGASIDDPRNLAGIFGSSSARHTPIRDESDTTNPDLAAWSHVTHILGLTRDLIASRRATNTYPFFLCDNGSSYSPMRGRSRRGSTTSSNSDAAELARSVASARSRSGTSRIHSSTASPSTAVSTKGSLIRKAGSLSSLEGTSSTASCSLPPRYSDDGNGVRQRKGSGASEGQIRDYQARGLLPAYGYEEKSSHPYHPLSRLPAPFPEKGILISSPPLTSAAPRPSTPLEESPPADLLQGSAQSLDAVQSSIERVTLVAPQLANQRAISTSASRKGPADFTLEQLIDRLAVSGKRMDDQRVMASKPKGSRHRDSSDPISAFYKPSNMLKRLSSTAQIAGGFRRVATAGGRGKEKSYETSSKENCGGDTSVSMPVAWTDVSSRSRRSTPMSLRSKFFKDHMVESKQQPHTSTAPDLQTRPGVVVAFPHAQRSEDTELFDLLASAASRNRFSNQEAVMKPKHRRNQTISLITSRGEQGSEAMTTSTDTYKAHSHDEDFRLGAGGRRGNGKARNIAHRNEPTAEAKSKTVARMVSN